MSDISLREQRIRKEVAEGRWEELSNDDLKFLLSHLDTARSDLRVIQSLWRNHEHTKFAGDGSHFQADIAIAQFFLHFKVPDLAKYLFVHPKTFKTLDICNGRSLWEDHGDKMDFDVVRVLGSAREHWKVAFGIRPKTEEERAEEWTMVNLAMENLNK